MFLSCTWQHYTLSQYCLPRNHFQNGREIFQWWNILWQYRLIGLTKGGHIFNSSTMYAQPENGIITECSCHNCCTRKNASYDCSFWSVSHFEASVGKSRGRGDYSNRLAVKFVSRIFSPFSQEFFPMPYNTSPWNVTTNQDHILLLATLLFYDHLRIYGWHVPQVLLVSPVWESYVNPPSVHYQYGLVIA